MTATSEEIMQAAKGFVVSSASILGLKLCKWPGRNQIIELKTSRSIITFFLDGAHTAESIQHCVEWFMHASESKRYFIILYMCNARGYWDFFSQIK